MGRKIHILAEDVVNQIAAGEIIERPASILKELLENSIDAGATQIDVETRSGGISWIKVKDDGCGMNKEDAFLSLERHATSKLYSLNDFSNLMTYGFRGEALPAIASVTKFTLATQEKDSPEGVIIEVHGGKIVRVEQTAGLAGTSVTASSLFYNLPPRLKFLKSPQTELLHLQRQLILAALSHPEIGIRYSHSPGGKGQWEKGEDLWTRISSVLGEEWAKELCWIDKEGEGFRIYGAVSKPGVGRPSREDMFFFVNKRAIESRSFYLGVIDAYRNSLMKGLYPLCALYVEVNPDEIDINVHPTKKEVRFKREYAFRDFVYKAILEKLSTAKLFSNQVVEEQIDEKMLPENSKGFTQLHPCITAKAENEKLFDREHRFHARAIEDNQGKENSVEYKVIGLFCSLYIAIETIDGIILIDQHAAHERVLFEKMLLEFESFKKQSQKLLAPCLLKLSSAEAEVLSNCLSWFEKLGFEIRPFGLCTFLLESIPSGIKRTDYEQFFREVIAELVETDRQNKTARFFWHRDIALAVCRQAIKSGDPLTKEEQEELVKSLFSCQFPNTCPHGRPTWIKINYKEIESRFGRSGPSGCAMKGQLL
ncbi:DNA mismatch repair endonuclease MutL [Methylacidiphilum caldifontis]|uniref:DNA mismatch repair protein MutL n=1 Tax=Methylacidiphilum caldifontis TaxID=2795386 RepID=A0A4Y8PE40_9BACT|nr:DNA mismatch repair endonuclease MutL [Methylacidiphilum caldifontis]QSR88053.1 DNA mismatch repair endonuclease MutL [Methylacidiphilum caldifontis]TFE69588.1 DNA mismatch repair protein MutL [Methylacidiphilum caldifontis]